MSKGMTIAVIGVFVWAIGILGVVFGVVTTKGWVQTCLSISPTACAEEGTQSEVTEITSCDDIASLTNRIICRTVTWGNPVWLAQKFISNAAPDIGEAFRAFTLAINQFFQIVTAGLVGFISLSTFQANAPQIIIMPIMIVINIFMTYTVIRVFRGGG